MKRSQYTPEYKIEAVKQVLERGHRIGEVALRLGISEKSLSRWVKQTRQSGSSPNPSADDIKLRSENAQLKAELKRTTEERDILKKATAYFAKLSG